MLKGFFNRKKQGSSTLKGIRNNTIKTFCVLLKKLENKIFF